MPRVRPPPCLTTRCRVRGFTLVEAMMTVLILAIIASIAVPTMQDLILTYRTRSAAEKLFGELLYARSEAIKRNGDIGVAWAANSSGWSVTVTSGGTTLARAAGQNDFSTSDTSKSLTYKASGRSSSTASTGFKVLANGAGQQRCVAIQPSGVPSIKVLATSATCP